MPSIHNVNHTHDKKRYETLPETFVSFCFINVNVGDGTYGRTKSTDEKKMGKKTTPNVIEPGIYETIMKSTV